MISLNGAANVLNFGHSVTSVAKFKNYLAIF